MRWARVALVGLVLVAVGSLVVEPLLHPTRSCPTQAAVPQASFVGTVVARDGPRVTFDIASLVPSRASGDDALQRGERVTVTYPGGDERFIHEGHRYLVDAYGTTPDALTSGVQTAEECPNAARGVGTYQADGTRIDTGLLTSDGIAPYLVPGGIAVAVLGTLVVAVAIVARRRRPRLTIDGRPITRTRGRRSQPTG